MFNIIQNAPNWGKYERTFPIIRCALERFLDVYVYDEYQICTRAGDQTVLLKYQISGLGVSHDREARGSVAKKNSRERERVSRDFSTHKLCARKGEERERERSLNHEEVQREFVSKLTRYCKLRLVKEWCFVVIRRERERKHNCASPSDDNLFYDWGVVFFFVFFFVCALFRSRLFAFARKQRKR